MIIGTAGHIDHGKTALVQAITGVNTDRLPEEKARGITIDIGFAHTRLGGRDVSFIDVPGHERFIKNMLAGIGGIDLVLLVIAADESVMPQTREHFEICKLLGIPRGVIAITKTDLVDSETLQIVHAEIIDLVRASFLEDAPVFGVSAKTGAGIEELKSGLSAEIAKIEERSAEGPLRLPIDRVFVLKGHGTVVTGTLISGSVQKDTMVDLLPAGRRIKVRSIHAHDASVEKAVAGQRTAMNLLGVEKENISRGDVLTEPAFFEPGAMIDARIDLLPGSRALRHNSIVRFHHFTNDVPARITLLGQDVLEPGEKAFAQLRLQNSIVAVQGDRFILRRHSPPVTIGGGLILDHKPARRVGRGDADALRRLKQLENAPPEERLTMAVRETGMAGAAESFLKHKLAMRPEFIRQIAGKDISVLKESPLLLMSSDVEKSIQQQMKRLIAEFHAANPLLPGIPKEELRTRFFFRMPSEVFHELLERAVGSKILQAQKDTIALHGRKLTLSNEEENLLSLVEQELARAGIESTFDGIVKSAGRPPEEVKKMLYLLLREGRAVKMADDYFLQKRIWEDLKDRIRSLKSTQSKLSVGDFKSLFGLSRKYAIPLLEQLDREGITRRAGNERIIM